MKVAPKQYEQITSGPGFKLCNFSIEPLIQLSISGNDRSEAVKQQHDHKISAG